MTSQPLSSDRFLMLLALSIGTSTVAQGVGLLVGASANIQVRLCLHIHLCAAIAQVKFTKKKNHLDFRIIYWHDESWHDIQSL